MSKNNRRGLLILIIWISALLAAGLFNLIINSELDTKRMFWGNNTYYKEASEAPQSDDKEMRAELLHMSRKVNDNLIIDADVYMPLTNYCPAFYVDKVNLPSENSRQLFFNKNLEGVVELYSDAWGRKCDEGDYYLATECGNEFTKVQYTISFSTSDLQRSYEIEDLMRRYIEAYPEKTENEAPFMARNDAIALACDTISNCGVNLCPVVTACIGMTHQEIMDWQKSLLENKDSHYDDFGKAVLLTNLSEKDDAYYFECKFSVNNINLYSSDEPSGIYADDALPPLAVGAQMLITEDGIQHLNIYPAYSVGGVYSDGSIISVEEVIAILDSFYGELMLENRYKVFRIFLEYIPINVDSKTVLTPYWCALLNSELIDEAGSSYWSDYPHAERFNAFTGVSLRYGG